MGLHENFTTDVSVDKEEMIKFLGVIHFCIQMQEFFWRILQHCDRTSFHNLAHISGKTYRSLLKFNHKCNFGQGSSRYILEVIWMRSLDPDSDLDEICLRRGMCCPSAVVRNLQTVIVFLLAFRYLNAIQTMCPHVLRYLTTAVITNRRRRQAHHHQLLKDLVKVIQQVRGRCMLGHVYHASCGIWRN